MREDWIAKTVRLSESADIAGAVAFQSELAAWIDVSGPLGNYSTVAGIDLSYRDDQAIAVIVVLDVHTLETLEAVWIERKVAFSYVPGLLAYREIPAFLDAYAKLRGSPDVLMFDGQGLAHPRRMGIASHAGLIVDKPSLGCAKSRLTGDYRMPGDGKFDESPLILRGETIGGVLRSKPGCKPLFVSAGHGMTPQDAMEIVKRTVTRYRLPEPTRRADKLTKELRAPGG